VSGVRGDFAQLQQLQVQLSRLGSPAGREGVIRTCAEASVKVLDDEFRGGHDPYGKAWKPLAFRQGKPLADTGAHLRSTLAPKVTATGFIISTAFPGAPVHQYGATIRAKGKALAFRGAGSIRTGKLRGTGKLKRPVRTSGAMMYRQKVTIPQRQYIPEGTPGPLWGKAIERAAETAVSQAMGGA
jgi:phage gpG-like protein